MENINKIKLSDLYDRCNLPANINVGDVFWVNGDDNVIIDVWQGNVHKVSASEKVQVRATTGPIAIVNTYDYERGYYYGQETKDNGRVFQVRLFDGSLGHVVFWWYVERDIHLISCQHGLNLATRIVQKAA